MNITELIADMQLHFPASSPKEVAKALLEQQRVIEQMRDVLAVCKSTIALAGWSGDCSYKLADEAIALQPDLTALREHDVEVVKAFVDALATYEKDPQQFVIEYIEHIRKGE